MDKLKIEYVDINSIRPYKKNPRKNDEAIPYVMESIKQFGFKNPVILDKDNVIVCGHTRIESAKRLGITEIPCIYADDLTDEQIKAFRLADNKVAEIAEWDIDLLDTELDDILNIDMSDFGFIDEIIEETEDGLDNIYTKKIKPPQYEITGEEPHINDLLDDFKAKELVKKIENSNITNEQKEFLVKAAARLYEFNYSNIAEYYAHQNKEMQELMEELALVIIDIKDAISNGYVELSETLEEMLNDEN